MTRRDLVDLLLLGAIWGSSFLFMRVAAPAFGPVPLIEVRVTVAAVFLTSILIARAGTGALRGHAFPLAVVGVVNSALPFSLFAYATLSVTAGFASVLNATAPLFGALVGYLWYREALSARRAGGLAIGFGGVALLAADGGALHGEGKAVLAGLLAAVAYGIAAHYSRRKLAGVAPLAVAAGSQIAASLALVPAAIWSWPRVTPPPHAWAAAVTLGLMCTGIAYILYFRLIDGVGATRAMAVAYLIPVFGMFWGALVLGESIRPGMLVGCAAILLGIATVTREPARRPSPAVDPEPGALSSSSR